MLGADEIGQTLWAHLREGRYIKETSRNLDLSRATTVQKVVCFGTTAFAFVRQTQPRRKRGRLTQMRIFNDLCSRTTKATTVHPPPLGGSRR